MWSKNYKIIAHIFVLIFTTIASSLFSQDREGINLQLQMTGGVFSPVDEEVQNVYGSGPLLQINLVAALNEQSRLKIGASYLRTSGNPYYSLEDFITDNTGRLTMNGLGLILELGGKSTNNPKVYFGAGVLYYFGAENIEGIGKNSGDGFGGIFSLTPEFRLSNSLYLVMEAALRLVEVKFRENSQRYTFNMTGGALSIGLAYRLGASFK